MKLKQIPPKLQLFSLTNELHRRDSHRLGVIHYASPSAEHCILVPSTHLLEVIVSTSACQRGTHWRVR